VIVFNLTHSQASRALNEVQSSPVVIAPSDPLLGGALAMAEALRHPVYDCVYLALAAEKKMALVTADGRLARVMAAQRKLAHVVVIGLGNLWLSRSGSLVTRDGWGVSFVFPAPYTLGGCGGFGGV
jgi:hypothetical protein